MKSRFESLELLKLRSLHTRIGLSGNDIYHYNNLEKGFIGEKKFDLMMKKNSNKFPILNDLLLQSNNTTFQTDSILLSKGILNLYDVKNYEGDYYIDGKRWYSVATGDEVKNPLLQLERAETSLRQLLHSHGFNTPIKSSLIFVNPNFYLYNVPVHSPMVFPTQINRFLKNLDLMTPPSKSEHQKLIHLLLSLHKTESSFTCVPKYTYVQFKKGVLCGICYFFMDNFSNGKLVCKKCGCVEDVEFAVLRNIEELKMLFQDMKITTTTVWDWCKIMTRKTIRRILTKHFKIVQKGRSSFYE